MMLRACASHARIGLQHVRHTGNSIISSMVRGGELAVLVAVLAVIPTPLPSACVHRCFGIASSIHSSGGTCLTFVCSLSVFCPYHSKEMRNNLSCFTSQPKKRATTGPFVTNGRPPAAREGVAGPSAVRPKRSSFESAQGKCRQTLGIAYGRDYNGNDEGWERRSALRRHPAAMDAAKEVDSMDLGLKGKVALITGGTKGIGPAAAGVGTGGCDIVAVYRSDAPGSRRLCRGCRSALACVQWAFRPM